MFRQQFHIRMGEARRARSLTQTVCAVTCGMKRSRWSDLERGARVPKWQERRAIDEFLNLGKVFVAPLAARRALLCSAARHLPTSKPYFPFQDRLTHIRYCACNKTYPELVDTLLMKVMRREDFELCEYFCHNVACDSGLEALYLLDLLQRGAAPVLLAPASLGHTRWPIVSCDGRREVGFRPRPCLMLNGTCHFFQVSFATPRIRRVDVLRWQRAWTVLEINGIGHNTADDSLRAAELEIPHSYLSEAELLWRAGRGLQKKAS